MEALKLEIPERGALEPTAALKLVVSLEPVAALEPPSNINSNSDFNSSNNFGFNLEEEPTARILRRKVDKDR